MMAAKLNLLSTLETDKHLYPNSVLPIVLKLCTDGLSGPLMAKSKRPIASPFAAPTDHIKNGGRII